jgi:uncharacterized protein YjbI with pentapeptide repeats
VTPTKVRFVKVNGYAIAPGANLAGANLAGADLDHKDLSGANLTDVIGYP